MTLEATSGEVSSESVLATAPAAVDATSVVATGARLGLVRSALAVAAIAFGVRSLVWNISIAPATPLGILFVLAHAMALGILTLTVIVLFDRGHRRLPGAATGSLDVFVTVCGEPAAVVEVAVRTTLAIDYPHRTVILNDGRIAGVAGWQEIDELGARLGVEVITRTSGARSKAGNLNNALAHSAAQFVATIDADHVVHADLATRLLPWFDDSKVGFVTARQQFDVVTDVLNSGETFFYDVIQRAKDAGGQAISCGSGVVYRRSALDDVGGFSEWNLVEDLHTSYRLHGAGWTSVYVPDAVTTGTAPATAAEHAHQRARWAIDTLRLLVFDCPLLHRGIGARTRLHYFQTSASYLQALAYVLFLAGPPLYVLLRVPMAGSASVGEYLAFTLPHLGLLLVFFGSLLGLGGALRTLRAAMFNDAITAVAVLRWLVGVRPSPVTQKGRQRRASWLLLLPIVGLVILVASLAVAIRDDRSGASRIAVVWTGLLALMLVGPLAAVSESRRVVQRTSRVAHAVVFSLAAVATVAAGVVTPEWQAVDPRDASADFVVEAAAEPVVATTTSAVPVTSTASTSASPVPTSPSTVTSVVEPTVPAGPVKLAVPSVGAYVGVAAEGMPDQASGSAPWQASNAGARPAIVHWFQQWGSGENRFRADWISAVAAEGAVPMISWEPWVKPPGRFDDPNQPEYGLARIVAGDFDEYIRSWCGAAAEYGGPLIVRLMHEFNGEWYPWSVGQQGQTATDFIASWRHIHSMCTEEGASNISWVWSVVGGFSDPSVAYPGDDVVDWVGATVLNFDEPEYGGSFDYATISASLYESLLAYSKPIMVAEVGTDASVDGAEWLRGMFDTVARDQPGVRAIVIFDMPYDDTTDFRLQDDASVVLADATRSGWFAPPVATR